MSFTPHSQSQKTVSDETGRWHDNLVGARRVAPMKEKKKIIGTAKAEGYGVNIN